MWIATLSAAVLVCKMLSRQVSTPMHAAPLWQARVGYAKPWLDMGETWADYLPEINQLIEKYWACGTVAYWTNPRNNITYELNPLDLVQTNVKTGVKRPVRRVITFLVFGSGPYNIANGRKQQQPI